MSLKEWNVWLNHQQEQEELSEEEVYNLLHKDGQGNAPTWARSQGFKGNPHSDGCTGDYAPALTGCHDRVRLWGCFGKRIWLDL